ncbi:hypothetical protein QBC46DRAFT_382148 [Diplogelasinospora grovesii]|uniref:Uncharacterized protein n=1 Tax=Diplogelasinospora grovesii TaxID=303347 RepID=A0AAN6NAG6_9PEZI|nr:hypothetical protein QBC46DRAFT_382148 [Diplogelasinospora grovesii]
MLDEFEVNVDDDSAFETAEQIMRVRGEVLRGKLLDGSELQSLRNRFDQTQKKGAGAALAAAMMFKRVEVEEVDADGEHEEWATDSDDDDDDEDGDEDVEMGDAAPPKPAEKKGPEVDEDGFTKVTRKKR